MINKAFFDEDDEYESDFEDEEEDEESSGRPIKHKKEANASSGMIDTKKLYRILECAFAVLPVICFIFLIFYCSLHNLPTQYEDPALLFDFSEGTFTIPYHIAIFLTLIAFIVYAALVLTNKRKRKFEIISLFISLVTLIYLLVISILLLNNIIHGDADICFKQIVMLMVMSSSCLGITCIDLLLLAVKKQ